MALYALFISCRKTVHVYYWVILLFCYFFVHILIFSKLKMEFSTETSSSLPFHRPPHHHKVQRMQNSGLREQPAEIVHGLWGEGVSYSLSRADMFF